MWNKGRLSLRYYRASAGPKSPFLTERPKTTTRRGWTIVDYALAAWAIAGLAALGLSAFLKFTTGV